MMKGKNERKKDERKKNEKRMKEKKLFIPEKSEDETL